MRTVHKVGLTVLLAAVFAGCGKGVVSKAEAEKADATTQRLRLMEDKLAALEKQMDDFRKSLDQAQTTLREQAARAAAAAKAQATARPAPRKVTAKKAAPATAKKATPVTAKAAGKATQPKAAVKTKQPTPRPANTVAAKPRSA